MSFLEQVLVLHNVSRSRGGSDYFLKSHHKTYCRQSFIELSDLSHVFGFFI